jgi:hypothetical protein
MRLMKKSFTLAFALGLLNSVAMAKDHKKAGKMPNLIPSTDIPWEPLDPSNPTGAQKYVISGDMKKASGSLWMLKVPAGTTFPDHGHTADYHAVVIQGNWKHTFDEKYQGKVEGGPGTTWYQPGKGTMHGDACLPGGDCIIAIQLHGKHDFIPKK